VAVIVPNHAVWKPLFVVGVILFAVAALGFFAVWLVLRRSKDIDIDNEYDNK
jgi:hypothetical protein